MPEERSGRITTKGYESFLDDGTRLIFRQIRPSDKEMLARGFADLSDRSRYERFFSNLKHLSHTQLRYLTEVDHQNHSAWVAIAEEPAGRRGVGVARWVRTPGKPDVAEVAVTVIDDYHRRGIGRTLLYIAAVSARSRGIGAFRAVVLSKNRATNRMLESMGAQMGAWESGVTEVTVPLRHTLATIAPARLSLKAIKL